MQRVIRHTGLFAPCRCGLQLKHVTEKWETRHFFECAPCGVRTAKFDTAQEAVQAWESQETVMQRVAA